MDLRAKKKLRSNSNYKESTKGQEKRTCAEKNPRPSAPSKRIRLDNRNVDKFCWICKSATLGHGKICSQCPRVYHVKCSKSRNSFDEKNLCPECQQNSVIGDDDCTNIPCNKLKELLMYAFDRIFEKKKQLKEAFDTWPEDYKNSKLYKIVDVQYFSQKLLSNSYKKPVEFFSDLKWLHHNCSIIYGEKSKYALDAEYLVKKLHEELSSLEACADCYFYRNSVAIDEASYFSLTCSQPHEVIWAKVKGFNYWPAKCLKVTKNGSAHTIFFGTHEISCVPSNMWFSLTSEHKSSQSSQQQGQYCSAIRELLKYKENMRDQLNTSKGKPKKRTNKDGGSSSVEKLSKETQTSTHLQGITDDYEPEILCVDSIENLSEDVVIGNALEFNPNLTDNNSNQTISNIASVSMTFCQEDTDSAHMSDDSDIQELLCIPKKSPFKCCNTNTDSAKLLDGEDIQELLSVSKNSSYQWHKDGCESDSVLEMSDREDIQILSVSNDPTPQHHQTECESNSLATVCNKFPSDNSVPKNSNELSTDNSLPNVRFSQNLLSDISGILSKHVPEQNVGSKVPSENHDFCSNNQAISNNLKDCERPLKLDTATLAKVISNKDPQFSKLFQEKSKDLIESMMVHVWGKLNSEIKTPESSTTLTSLVEETKVVKKQIEEDRQKLQALEESEKLLQNRLGNADLIAQVFRHKFRTQVQVVEEKNKMLSEMIERLANIKTEKAEITERCHDLEKKLSGSSSLPDS